MKNVNLNSKAKNSSQKLKNEENITMYKDRSDRSLLLQGLSLKLNHKFYKSPEETLKNFENIFQENENNVNFILASVFYLKNKGMKLSPALLLGMLSDKDIEIPMKLVRHVYTRPDFIANTFAYLKMKHNGEFHINENFKKRLKIAFENLDEITLKKRLMRRREWKTADLIKILKPKPRNEKYSLLYKNIIENKIRLNKNESLTVVLSDKNISEKEKKDFLKENIKNISINEIIKNSSQLNNNFDLNTENDLVERLNGLNLSQMCQLNPFDLVISQENMNINILSCYDKVIKKYTEQYSLDFGNTGWLIDTSGSMNGEGINLASKFLSVFRLINEPQKVNFFNNFLIENKKIENLIKNISSPNQLYKIISSVSINGGTNLRDCLIRFIQNNKDLNTIVLITDEYHNWQNVDIENFNIIVKNTNKKLIVFNTSYNNFSNFNVHNNIIKDNITIISSLNGKIFEDLSLMWNFDSYKEKIIKEYFDFIRNDGNQRQQQTK